MSLYLIFMYFFITEAGGSQDHPKHKPHSRMGGIVAEMLVRTNTAPHVHEYMRSSVQTSHFFFSLSLPHHTCTNRPHPDHAHLPSP